MLWSLGVVPFLARRFGIMFKSHTQLGPVPSPQFRTLLCSSLFVLAGSLASGCDAPSNAQSSQSSSQELSSGVEAVPHRAQKSGVQVRVAGQMRCRSCSIAELESVLGAKPRKALAKDPLFLPPELEAEGYAQQRSNYRWTVKFQDHLEVRLNSQRAAALDLLASKRSAETPNQGLAQLYSRRSGAELDAVEDLRQRYQARFLQEITTPEEEIDKLRERALRRSLVAQPDLAAIYRVEAEFESSEEMLRFGKELQALPEVEFVYLQPLNVPRPEDLPPKSSDLSGGQGFLGPNPGVNGEYAWKQGIMGEGVRVTDCEGGWEIAHEDLSENPIQIEKGQKPRGIAVDHGTAAMGMILAGHNGYGVKGLAPKVSPAAYPDYPNRQVTAVTNALKDSEKGDILMLELQTSGRSGRKFVPVEYDKRIWTVVKTGTDAGVLVIAAAGNGGEDLDDSFYKSYMDRGDSGAIIVGAGTANSQHNKMGFSTYGKRVNVHGWGEKVVTTGYGDLKKFGGEERQKYTRQFAGTSSATPVVVGSAALIQSFVKKEHDRVLSPKEMRTLLVETGVAQGSGGHIGPIPDVKAAFEKMGKGEKDEEKPKVKITKPKKDIKATLEKDQDAHALKIEVEASDNKALKSVHLEVDGKKIGDADEEEPYIFDVELEAGSYKIVAVATDSSKNEGRSKELEAKISPFDEKSGGEESESGSESESDSDSDSAGESESGGDDTKGDESESDSESGSESGADTEKESDSGGDSDSETGGESEGESDGSSQQAEPEPKPVKKGCAMQDTTPLPATLAFGLLILAGLRRPSRREA